MSNKLKISTKSSEQLEYITNRLGLRRNVVCRLAIGRSLTDPNSVKTYKAINSAGYEFNRYTLTGDYDDIFIALITQHEKRRLSDNDYFSKFLRKHIERGIDYLFKDYQKINSPVEFLMSMADNETRKVG